MSRPNIKVGCSIGTGAAINVELGWVPDTVELYNATSGLLITTAYLIPWVVPFTSGGLNATSGLNVETVAGSTIRSTSGVTATVDSVLLASGTFAVGDAAGFFVLKEGTLVGTFGTEDVAVTNAASGTVTTATGLDASVTANVVHNSANNSAAVAAATGTSAISRYEGVAGSASKGFTIGSVISADNALLRWRAFRGDVV